MKRLTIAALLMALLLSFLVPPAREAEAAQQLLNRIYITADVANVRAAPTTASPVMTRVFRGEAVLVGNPVQSEAVNGNTTWYRTRSGWYLSETVTTNVPGTQTIAFTGPRSERWIDINLTTATARAMQGNEVVYSAPIVSGRPGLDTPVGTFRIQWRAVTRTMDSATIGIPHSQAGAYVIPNVRYAQYFTNVGHAIHGNYWIPPEVFGSGRTSRGCVGLRNEDAKVFWDFASVGTRVEIHY
jgi:lipoprotein-anchoring transpeptidase ErfK/SrfK